MSKKLLKGKFSGQVYINGKLYSYPDVYIYETETQYYDDILLAKIIKNNSNDNFVYVGLTKKRKIINLLLKLWDFLIERYGG